MNIRFAFPLEQLFWWAAGAALLLAALYWLLSRLEQARARRLALFADALVLPRLLSGYDAALRRPLFWLGLLGVAFLLAALAEPRWGRAWTEQPRVSRDVMVVLDISESMNAEDLPPSRIERARRKIDALMARSPGDRFGLIVFSGAAELQCPLTLDHGYVRSVLSAVHTDVMTLEGTDIEAGLEQALAVFLADSGGTAELRRLQRAVWLISDGEQVRGDAERIAARLGKHAQLYVMGMGLPGGAPVRFPEWMTRHVRPANSGQPHLSKLDEPALIALARAARDGVYVRTTADDKDIGFLAGELETLAGRASESELRFGLVNRYRWPLTLAFLCFLAEGAWVVLLPLVRRRKLRGNGGWEHA